MRSSLAAALAFVTLIAPIGAFAGGPAPAAASKGWGILLSSPRVHHPTGLAIDLRGNKRAPKWAYTADAASGRIVKFGTNGRVLGSWRYAVSGEHTTGAAVAVGGSGNVFVADPVVGTLAKYTPSGKLLARWSGFAAPQSLAVAPSGTIYLAETGAHRITALSPAGTVIKHWDTAGGFLQEYTVPPTQSGQLGYPTNVAVQLPDSLFVSTRCVLGPSCTPSQGALPSSPSRAAVDALLTLRISGFRAGYLGDWWFGLGHALNGTPQEYPAKESEPFVTIDSLTSNQNQRAYLAGELWVIGQHPERGVITYTSLGVKNAYWPLPSQSIVRGIAVDGQGQIYVAQGGHILRLNPAVTPGQVPPY